MDESEAQVDAHNARDLIEEIDQHLADAMHSINLMRGCLDDLAIYMPKDTARS